MFVSLWNLWGVVGKALQRKRSGGYMGLSFAIPIDVAMDVADQLKRHGKVSRGRLGVVVQDVSDDLAQAFGRKQPSGALVAEIEPDGPADKAGLRPADIILSFAGRTIDRSMELPRMIGTTAPGTRAALTVWRNGAERVLNVEVGEVVDESSKALPGAVAGKPMDGSGLVVSALAAEDRRALRVDSGVRVEDAVGAAARGGIRPGDIIVSVNNQPVNSAAELSSQFNDSGRNSFAVLVKRGDGSLYVPLRVD